MILRDVSDVAGEYSGLSRKVLDYDVEIAA